MLGQSSIAASAMRGNAKDALLLCLQNSNESVRARCCHCILHCESGLQVLHGIHAVRDSVAVVRNHCARVVSYLLPLLQAPHWLPESLTYLSLVRTLLKEVRQRRW